jgi:hypothetical protein
MFFRLVKGEKQCIGSVGSECCCGLRPMAIAQLVVALRVFQFIAALH